ncbi:MAG TPA: histidine phosphatase family protein [Rhodocyclaceae bacterium]|nr:histidine phosphatase family protein [Rhodocyclaceae bacterium]
MGLSRATRLCLVRHGETEWNRERRLQGHLDVPLNATGREQARATATHLVGHAFAALYCSDLARARQTAHTVAAALAGMPRPTPALRERHYGAFQGLTYDAARARFPDEFARFSARDADFAFPGGGESLRGFATRVEAAVREIAARHAGQQVLIVTHGGVLDVVHRLATGKPLDAARDFAIPNAALNWIAFENGRWQLVSWAEQAHLACACDELPNA